MANVVRDKSFEFAVQIVSCYRVLSSERKEFVLSKQLLRAGTSVGANVREGVNAQSTPDLYINFPSLKKNVMKAFTGRNYSGKQAISQIQNLKP